MQNTIYFRSDKKSPFSEFYFDETYKEDYLNNPFVKQKMHESRVDEFFLTDSSAPDKRQSFLAGVGALLGVVVPTVILAKKQNPGLKPDSIKKIWKFIDINYGIKEILVVGLGGMIGGLLGGLFDPKEHDKLNKLEEASFQFMNIALPAVLVDTSLKISSKIKLLNNAVAKTLLVVGGIALGVSIAVKTANAIDDKLFDIYNHDSDRKFRKKDLIVHLDDLCGTLVLAKFPLADKLHINKILPLIYAWCGYHVGDY